MKKEDLKIGDVVYLKHDARNNYTYVAPAASNVQFPSLDASEIGVFAYNTPLSLELTFVHLPIAAVCEHSK